MLYSKVYIWAAIRPIFPIFPLFSKISYFTPIFKGKSYVSFILWEKVIQFSKQQYLEEENILLDKQNDLAHQMNEAEYLIAEETNRLGGALKTGGFPEIHAATVLIARGCAKFTSISKQQQLSNEFDKLRLKIKDAFLHEQSIKTRVEFTQNNLRNVTDLIDNS